MSNDAHPQQPDAKPWHTVKPSGQYRFGLDITGSKSWQCKLAGLTIYGLETKTDALAKIRELRNEKLQADFFRIANIEK